MSLLGLLDKDVQGPNDIALPPLSGRSADTSDQIENRLARVYPIRTRPRASNRARVAGFELLCGDALGLGLRRYGNQQQSGRLARPRLTERPLRCEEAATTAIFLECRR